MLTKEQLEMRKSGLGGSDVAVALGLSPWKTQLQLWAEKIGKLEDNAESAAMEWGSRLEDAVATKFAEEHANDYELITDCDTVRHPEYPFLLATPDGYLHSPSEPHSGILEVKTSAQQPWESVPEYYLLQAQHYCYVTQRDFFCFAVLFNGRDYREYGPYQFVKEAYEEQVLPHLAAFWKAVEDGVPNFTVTDINDLNLIVDVDSEKEITCEIELRMKLDEYRGEKLQADYHAEQVKRLRKELAESMGDAHRLVDDEGKTLAVQIQTKDSMVIDSKKLKAEKPETFDMYSKIKRGYRSVRVY